MESNDQKAFVYVYNTALAICLLHAAFLGISFVVSCAVQGYGGFIEIIRAVWVPLFLAWPVWPVVLVVFWFFGDRKLWRLLSPLGLGIMYIMCIASFVVYVIWRIDFHGWRT